MGGSWIEDYIDDSDTITINAPANDAATRGGARGGRGSRGGRGGGRGGIIGDHQPGADPADKPVRGRASNQTRASNQPRASSQPRAPRQPRTLAESTMQLNTPTANLTADDMASAIPMPEPPTRRGGARRPEIPADQLVDAGAKYLVFLQQKGSKVPTGIATKIQFGNNAAAVKAKVEEGCIGKELRTELVLSCPQMDAVDLFQSVCSKYASKHIRHNWYNLKKEDLQEIHDAAVRNGCQASSEGRAKLTKAEIKTLELAGKKITIL